MAEVNQYGSGGVYQVKNEKINNAKMTDPSLLIQAGINPKNGLPLKMSKKTNLKEALIKATRVADEQAAVNRYVWYNIPADLSSQELERLLYYKGQLAFFYLEDKFYFMPYALDGTIDFYGRYNTIHPVPISASGDEKQNKVREKLLADIKLNVVKGIKLPEELEMADIDKSAVILRDYTNQLSQTIIPRVSLQEGVIESEVDCLMYGKTALKLGTGVKGLRVQDADQADSVLQANESMDRAALDGDALIPIIGKMEFQEIANGSPLKGEEFLLMAQSYDNIRLGLYGLDNGGIFQKKAHELQSEADMAGGPVGLVLQDGLAQRQEFCNIVNSIWGVNIWCEIAQNVAGMDNDGDGAIDEDNSDGANTGVEGGESNDNDSEI